MGIALLDIGGTAIKSAFWNGKELVNQKETPTPSRTNGETILKVAAGLLEQQPKFDKIGVSSTGQINSQLGEVIYANENVKDYTGTNIRGFFENRFAVPVAVENDVNAAALGELHFGVHTTPLPADFICLTYGTGVGGAIVIDNKIYHGSRFNAGEFGATITHAAKLSRDGFFMDGRYETYASTTALVNMAMKIDESLTTGRLIFENMGRSEIKNCVDAWILEIVYGLTTIVHVFGTTCLLLGGGVMAQDYVICKIKELLEKRIMKSFLPIDIRKTTTGNGAGMLGVLWLAEQMKG